MATIEGEMLFYCNNCRRLRLNEKELTCEVCGRNDWREIGILRGGELRWDGLRDLSQTSHPDISIKVNLPNQAPSQDLSVKIEFKWID